MRHGRLSEGAVSGIGVTGRHRTHVARRSALGETIDGIIVVVSEGRSGTSSLGRRLRNLAIELLGAPTTNGIGDEGDKKDEGDKTDDREDASDGAGVLEEPWGA